MVSDRSDREPLADVAGVALAGGRSTRMGSDKATLKMAGTPLIARVAGALRHEFSSVVVIGPASLARLTPDVRVIPDAQPGQGPLGGLYTALTSVQTSWIALVGCDMPFLQSALIRHIAEQALASSAYDVVAMRAPDGWEPLHAAYRRDLAPQVARALAGPRPSMRGLLSHARVLEVSPEAVAHFDPRGLSTFNANTPEEWSQAERLARDVDSASRQGG